MKSLEVIQKIVKVLRILAKIAYIFCIIGAVASAIGAASLFAIDENSEIWKKALEAIQPDTIDLAAVRCTCLTGVIVCAAGAVLSWFSKRLFEDELAAGTPFDRHICKDVLKVGIIYLAVSVVSGIIMANLRLLQSRRGRERIFGIHHRHSIYNMLASVPLRRGR